MTFEERLEAIVDDAPRGGVLWVKLVADEILHCSHQTAYECLQDLAVDGKLSGGRPAKGYPMNYGPYLWEVTGKRVAYGERTRRLRTGL